MKKVFIAIFVLFGVIVSLSLLSIAQELVTESFSIAVNDPNIPDIQKQIIERKSQEIAGSDSKLFMDSLTSIAEKNAKIKRNNESIKEYQKKIVEWEALNTELKNDIKEIKKLGLDIADN